LFQYRLKAAYNKVEAATASANTPPAPPPMAKRHGANSTGVRHGSTVTLVTDLRAAIRRTWASRG
jgi:hypothetical protein